MKTVLILWTLTMLSACVADVGGEEVESSEHAIDSPSTSTCYWGSGQYWCKDYYTGRWCTGATAANGYDWTGCNWDGWRDGLYCYQHSGWQWGEEHRHCP